MANPNVGVIRDGGVVIPYTICPDLTSLSGSTASTSAAIQTMIYGNPLNYELGLFSDFTVRVDESYKAQERLLTILGDVMVGAAAASLAGAGVREPQDGSPRSAQYLQCVKYLALDLYDRREPTITGTIVATNPVFRAMLNQLKLTEPVPDSGTGEGAEGGA